MSRSPKHPNDDDRTDELPVIAATAVLRRTAFTAHSDLWTEQTGEHTVVLIGSAVDSAAPASGETPPAAVAALKAEVDRWSARCRAAEESLADKNLLVADLDAAMAAARRALEAAQRERDEVTTERAALDRALGIANSELDRLRMTPASPAAAGVVAPYEAPEPTDRPDGADLERALEDYAALATYVDGRKAWWDQAQAQIASLSTKVAALEHELAERGRHLTAAESLAASESERANEYRQEAIRHARLARELPREGAAAAHAHRDDRTTRAAAELASLRTELAATRTELANEREAGAALKLTIAEQARELAARSERLSALQQELEERLLTLEKLNAMDLSLQGLKAKIARRAGAPVVAAPPPALVCLTGDAPARIPLQGATTFGRGAHCNVQILTHYVSREHARIVVSEDGATIEDLGSRNGVFVNAVKTQHQQLRQGDLIKIGETQFRFVESMAH